MSTKVHDYGGGLWAFHCPGCKFEHAFRVNNDKDRPQWTFNNDLVKPTFHPSLIVNRGTITVCHLFVTDGRIQFLMDSHHDLRGKTVDMEDWETLA